MDWLNSIVTPFPENMHQVWYLPQISLSPSQHSLVAETMKRSLIAAMKPRKTSIAITDDLAIAKVVMQIQSQESPKSVNYLLSLEHAM